MADTLVDSIHYRAPADKMFGAPIRAGGLFALERYDISEGVPLAMVFMIAAIAVVVVFSRRQIGDNT